MPLWPVAVALWLGGRSKKYIGEVGIKPSISVYSEAFKNYEMKLLWAADDRIFARPSYLAKPKSTGMWTFRGVPQPDIKAFASTLRTSAR